MHQNWEQLLCSDPNNVKLCQFRREGNVFAKTTHTAVGGFLDAIARPKHQEEAKTTTKLNLKWVKLPTFQIQIHQMHCSFTH